MLDTFTSFGVLGIALLVFLIVDVLGLGYLLARVVNRIAGSA